MSALRGVHEPISVMAESEPAGVCYFYGRFSDCQNVNPQWCGMCSKFLCDVCRNDYWRRAQGFSQESGQRIRQTVREVFDKFL